MEVVGLENAPKYEEPSDKGCKDTLRKREVSVPLRVESKDEKSPRSEIQPFKQEWLVYCACLVIVGIPDKTL